MYSRHPPKAFQRQKGAEPVGTYRDTDLRSRSGTVSPDRPLPKSKGGEKPGETECKLPKRREKMVQNGIAARALQQSARLVACPEQPSTHLACNATSRPTQTLVLTSRSTLAAQATVEPMRHLWQAGSNQWRRPCHQSKTYAEQGGNGKRNPHKQSVDQHIAQAVRRHWNDEDEYIDTQALRHFLLTLLRSWRPRRARQKHLWQDACWFLTRQPEAQENPQRRDGTPRSNTTQRNPRDPCTPPRCEAARTRRDGGMQEAAWNQMLTRLHQI